MSEIIDVQILGPKKKKTPKKKKNPHKNSIQKIDPSMKDLKKAINTSI